MKKYGRSSTDYKIAGVCGGFAEYFNVDPLIVRIIFASAFLFWGVGGILYIVLWILAPYDYER